jgi:hypothetical protein
MLVKCLLFPYFLKIFIRGTNSLQLKEVGDFGAQTFCQHRTWYEAQSFI